jgi:hypothetical protein
LRRIAFKSVNEPSLSGAEREPVSPGLLQLNKELATAFHCLFVQLVATRRWNLTSNANSPHIGRWVPRSRQMAMFVSAVIPLPKYPQVLEHLLDYGPVHQFVTAIRGLQTFRHLYTYPGCIRRERIAGWALHPLESAALSRRPWEADLRLAAR